MYIAIIWFNQFYLYYRIDVIDEDIERAVSLMQNIIELGRKIRDRKTLPIKVNSILLKNTT